MASTTTSCVHREVEVHREPTKKAVQVSRRLLAVYMYKPFKSTTISLSAKSKNYEHGRDHMAYAGSQLK